MVKILKTGKLTEKSFEEHPVWTWWDYDLYSEDSRYRIPETDMQDLVWDEDLVVGARVKT